MKRVSSLDNSVSFFEDEETNARYRRIVAGLCWPAVKPGFIVVVGEDLNKDAGTGKHNMRVLAEAEDADIANLLRKCLDLQSSYAPTDFLTDTADRGMMDRAMQFNRNLEKPLRLRNAPYVEDPRCLRQYAMSIKGHLLPPDKTLYFDETSRIPSYLNELDSKELLIANILDYPTIAALGFAVCYLDRAEYRPPRPPQREANPGKLGRSYAVKSIFGKSYAGDNPS
jgi:hypothetical protein